MGNKNTVSVILSSLTSKQHEDRYYIQYISSLLLPVKYDIRIFNSWDFYAEVDKDNIEENLKKLSSYHITYTIVDYVPKIMFNDYDVLKKNKT